jgi:hypothetical protein
MLRLHHRSRQLSHGLPLVSEVGVTYGVRVDTRWAGIIEVLVESLDGAVRWEPDLVMLRLPGRPGVDREADLDALRLCLGVISVPVVFEPCRGTLSDTSLTEFLRRLTESGLAVDIGRVAA